MNYFDNPDYVVAIVGAGRGIGKAAALHIAGHGVRVACLDRDGDSAKA
ncbi:MAG: dehydrogenase, partial [Rhodospirillaceae bacterium]|nr:dehydrogenase [Rhodospirillaceae bacterium]